MPSTALLKLIVELEDKASGALGTIGGAVSRVGETALGVFGGNLLTGAVEKLGGGFLDAAKQGFSFNNSMEQVTAKLNAFTKDGAKSAEILEMIKKEAASTPFAFEEMAQSTAALLPVAKQSGEALDSLLKKAEILAASNPAEGLEGAAFALKEAASGDFTSIIERFNLPRQYLNDLKKQGIPAAQAVGMAMQQMGLDIDLVSNLANTADGRWSTFKDTLVNVAATATKPIFDAFSGGLATVNDWLTKNQPLLDQAGAFIAGTLTQALNGIGSLVDTIIPKISDFVAAFQVGAEDGGGFLGGLANALYSLDTLSPIFDTLGDAVNTFTDLWESTLWPAIQTVAGFIGDNLMPILEGLAAALGGALLVGAISTAAAVLGALLSPIGLIAAGVALLSIAWTSNWGNIQGIVATIWATLQPILAELVTWLATNIPVAIQAASNFWTNTLQPALAAVWDFIQANVIPLLSDLQTWLATNIPVAIQALADFWTNTLQPALNTVWSFIQSNIIPILQVLADTWIAALKLEVQALADLWTGTLQPALSAVWDFIQNSVIPLFQALWNVEIAALKLALRELSDVWTGTLQPALQTAYDFFNANILPVLKTVADVVTNTVGAAFGGLATKIGGVGEKLSGLKSIIDGAIGWLNGLAQKIDSVNSKPKPSYGAGGGDGGSFDDGSSGSSKRGLMGMSRSMQALQLPLNGITQQMQQLATAMTFVADREQQLAITKALSDKFKALQGDAKTTAALYAQLGDNVKFLADAMTTYKQVENTDKKGKGVGTYHTEVDQYKLTESQVAAFKREFDKAAQDAYTIQQQYGQEAAKAYYDSQSTYLQDEANLQVAYNQAAQDGNTAQMAALTEQMNLRYKQHEAELAALEEEQGAALAAIEAQKQAADAAYNAAMQHIKDIFEAQRRANLKGAADLYSLFSDTSGQLADMLANAYQTAYDSALGDAKLPDPGTLSNAELEQAYAAYQAKVTDAEAAGTAAQAKIQAVQQQLLDLQQQALQIAQVDPQAAADFYAMEQKYVLQVSDLQDKIANATSDQQRAALQQQLDYLEKSHSYQEQLFQANLDQYGQNLSDAQQAAQDAAAQTGDSALQTYANQIGQMFVLFQQQLSGAVASATMTALHLPTATMPNLTNRSGGAPAGGVSYGDIHITVNGAQTQNETHLAKRIGEEIEKRLQAKAESAARLSRGAGNKRY